MKKIYKRIKVNKALLKTMSSKSRLPVEDYLQSEVSDTIPTGKVIGVYYISYFPSGGIGLPHVGEGRDVMRLAPFGISQTDITLKDSRGHLLTATTDIKDYEHKNGGYNEGFKELDFESNNERVTISWETIGRQPICGEFIFEIEAPKEC
ncbi:conserved hypothetical protein [Tenacibaculum sp. 190130A14a]|uniref:hypothetical protein n=1 Tax=Tenacibaculum polynesiense TaxID=3137857 RepID=UPI003202734E